MDDDNYVNVGALLKFLARYPHTQDMYVGKPSLDRPIEATERLGDNKMKPVNFWFATGGAGFCISRGLALKMMPWARWVSDLAPYKSVPDFLFLRLFKIRLAFK